MAGNPIAAPAIAERTLRLVAMTILPEISGASADAQLNLHQPAVRL
jgi:hypothetical protein